MADKKCSERIEDSMRSREEYLDELYSRMRQDDEEAYDELADFGLGVEKIAIVKILLSTGGPADWIEAEVVGDGNVCEIVRMNYHFSDWFDHAEMRIDENSSLYMFAEEIVDSVYS